MANIMKKNNKEPYIHIPLWFIKLTSYRKSPSYLTPFECQLYWLIKGLCNEKECYANNQYFAKTFNVTIKHINKSIHKLELLRLLYIKHENNKRFIGVSKIDKGTMLFFTDLKKVCITTEDDFLEFTLEEWGKISDEDKNKIITSMGDKPTGVYL
jgi:hypothetical protein